MHKVFRPELMDKVTEPCIICTQLALHEERRHHRTKGFHR